MSRLSRFSSCSRALPPDAPDQVRLVPRLRGPRPAQQRLAGGREVERVRTPVVSGGLAHGEPAALELVHHRDEVRLLDAERAAHFATAAGPGSCR